MSEGFKGLFNEAINMSIDNDLKIGTPKFVDHLSIDASDMAAMTRCQLEDLVSHMNTAKANLRFNVYATADSIKFVDYLSIDASDMAAMTRCQLEDLVSHMNTAKANLRFNVYATADSIKFVDYLSIDASDMAAMTRCQLEDLVSHMNTAKANLRFNGFYATADSINLKMEDAYRILVSKIESEYISLSAHGLHPASKKTRRAI